MGTRSFRLQKMPASASDRLTEIFRHKEVSRVIKSGMNLSIDFTDGSTLKITTSPDEGLAVTAHYFTHETFSARP